MDLLSALIALLLTFFTGGDVDHSSDTSQAIVQEQIQEIEAICGNAVCESTESCSSCSDDCGICDNEVKDQIKEYIVWVKYDYFAEIEKTKYDYRSVTGSGVIIDENENYLYVLSNRHVLDCRYTGSCWKVWNENMTIQTQDGVTHKVERVYFDPEYLDIAHLRVRKASSKTYSFANEQAEVNKDELVIAAGYPASKLGGGVVAYSSKSGTVLDITELILPNGRKLESIESDAFTYYGSSGGGLFNEQGELVGINTWGIDLNEPDSSESIAIKITSLVPREDMVSCKTGEYITIENACEEYYGTNHRVVCFFSDQKTLTPLSGRVYYNGENQGKTIDGCREIEIGSATEEGLIEFDRDYASGIVTYNIEYNYPLKAAFAASWFVE